MRKIKNILILAGGDSTRFWPLKRKSYFSFLGHPLLWHQLNNLNKFATNLYVVISNEDDQSINRLDSDINFEVIQQKKELNGQAGAILSAKGKINGEVLVLNAEDIIDFELLYRYIDITISNRVDFLFAAKKVKKYFPGAYLKFDRKRLVEIIEKPDPNKTPSDLTKLVVDYLRDFVGFTDILASTKSDKDDQYEQAINKLLKQSVKVRYLTYDNYWYVLKYPWHVLTMTEYFLKTLKDKIKLGKNVKITKTAKIVGPCFIRAGTIMGDYVMVRQSHIGKNCLIGGYSEITRSYLGNGVSLHRNYIGDSVLADNVSFGAQAATANFRFDEKSVKSSVNGKRIDTNFEKFGAIIGVGSKIGVNATLLPGVKIGSNTFIGPGETIYEDVEDNLFVLKGKQTKNII